MVKTTTRGSSLVRIPFAILAAGLFLVLACASTGERPVPGSSRAVPDRIVAQVDYRRVVVGTSPVTVLDFHEDWDGGSGGLLMTARIEGGKLRVTTVQSSRQPNDRRAPTTDEQEFGLEGFRSATVQTPAGTVVFSAEP